MPTMSEGFTTSREPGPASHPQRPTDARGALPRPRLLDALHRRWRVRCVLLLAGPGFGKSTLLGQAIAANHDDPSGTDHYLRCTPSHAAADTLFADLAAALNTDPRTQGVRNAAGMIELLRAKPVGTCVMLDDLHELPEGSEGAAALRSVVRNWPVSCPLVLASRHEPDLALSAWEAKQQLVRITEDDLRFSASELAEVAEAAGIDHTALDATAGWPALVELVINGATGPSGFTTPLPWPQLLGSIPQSSLRLIALALLTDGADHELLSAMAGAPFDLDALRRLPLIEWLGNARDELQPHPLWNDAVGGLLHPSDAAAARSIAGRVMLRREDHDRALRLFSEAGDIDGCAATIVDTCRRGYAATPPDVVRRWLRLVPPALLDRPEGRLLRGIEGRTDQPLEPAPRHATGHATGPASGPAWLDDLTAAAEGFRSAGAIGPEVAALSELAYVARNQTLCDRTPPIVGRLFELVGSGEPAVEGALQLARIMKAEQLDQDHTVLLEIAALRDGAIHPDWMAPVEVARSNSLILLGRPDEALAAARRASTFGGSECLGGRSQTVYARWWQGVDASVVDDIPVTQSESSTTPVERFVGATMASSLLSFAGRTEDAQGSLAVAMADAVPQMRPEFHGYLAFAEANLAIALHDEASARASLERFFSVTPIDNPLGLRTVRRFLGVTYVLFPEHRQFIEAMPLGPALREALSVAMWFAALRSSSPTPNRHERAPAEPGFAWVSRVANALPLSWAVELDARLVGVDEEKAVSLAEVLLSAFRSTARAELRHLSTRHDVPDGVVSGARRLLAAVPLAPSSPLEVRLLGPTELRIGERPLEVPELRRARVRDLLALLALRRTVPREEVASILWPELDAAAASRNLRVNLTHLQRALEPDRLAGDAPFVLRQDGPLLSLAGEPWVSVDIHRFAAQLQAADRAEADGLGSAMLEGLESAVSLIRGLPFQDVSSLSGIEIRASRLRAEATRAAVRASELRHSLGDDGIAVAHARLALSLEPRSEAAARALAAAQLGLGDELGARRTLEACIAALAAAGFDPDAATAMLARRVAV